MIYQHEKLIESALTKHKIWATNMRSTTIEAMFRAGFIACLEELDERNRTAKGELLVLRDLLNDVHAGNRPTLDLDVVLDHVNRKIKECELI